MEDNYQLLLDWCRNEEVTLIDKYKALRGMLEGLCNQLPGEEGLQMTDLSAKISFVAAKFQLSSAEENRLHTVRMTANRILNHEIEPQEEMLFRDIKTVAFFMRRISGIDIPKELYQLLPRQDATYIIDVPGVEKVQRMRVRFADKDETYLYVYPNERITEKPWRVRYGLAEINEEFNDTIELLWEYAQLNLLDVSIDEEDILTPRMIVLEPDYLIDISTLAENFKDYGSHPLNFILSRFQKQEVTLPILLGNIANLFLDEWINSKTAPDYNVVMKKAFKMYALELASCPEFKDREKSSEFFENCKLHFCNIQKSVMETFQADGYLLQKDDAVLEPSYICEALGLQGRLDYMQRDLSAFIEMKSGKADEFTVRGAVVPKENNRVQMLLYQAVLEYALGQVHQKVKSYLLYTRYPLLYPARSSWAMLRRIINVRNKIIANEYGVQLHNNCEYTRELFRYIQPNILNEKELSNKFWTVYLAPKIFEFGKKLSNLTEMESDYFFTLYNFITKELYTSKSGDINYKTGGGASALWSNTLEGKIEEGEILFDLRVVDNHASDEHKAYIVLRRQLIEGLKPVNFREGDAVVLYERSDLNDNVTNKMIFKGNIEYITEKEVTMRLRATQRNKEVLPDDGRYAMEHDYMDTSFRAMYQGLVAFLNASKDRKDLLLRQRTPQVDDSYDEEIAHAEDDFERIIAKAVAAKDMFLLVGPPGTGKTSMALKGMVKRFYNEGKQILLMAYTNRAVDEICKSVSSIEPDISFIRLGSEINCDAAYRPYLLENVVEQCTNRRQLQDRIEQCRVFIGTVATLSSKNDLFNLKHFDVAIIDEATQILEPQLLNLLCCKGADGRESIDKFIMIGDHKQLPAIVLQRECHSEVESEVLRNIGLHNLKDSLFERLFRYYAEMDENYISSPYYDMLCRHGRMNEKVAEFANIYFYHGLLSPVGLAHQAGDIVLPAEFQHELRDLLLKRVGFIPSKPEHSSVSCKENRMEAEWVARIVKAVYEAYHSEKDFDVSKAIGVITPYRSQIALIRKCIERLGIASLNNISVDTVERFQGSERDVIIYSICVNHPFQLQFLSNIMMERGKRIDRKLNVALTRARKQLFILGVPKVLEKDMVYGQLFHYMQENGYVWQ